VSEPQPVPALIPDLEFIPEPMRGGPVCAIVADGAVECRGRFALDADGQPQIEAADPFMVPGVVGASAVAASYTHACAIVSEGRVRCWGANGSGQLGAATPDALSAESVEVIGVSRAIAVSAGEGHTCALVREGRVWCWGSDTEGQSGSGARTWTPVPVIVGDE
jgi:alpha-tubulin suppressor-like RCC1 family protein